MGEIDSVIYPLPRFKICAVLKARGAVEKFLRREMKFSALRKELGVSDPTLSKHLGVLEKAGYVDRFREYGATRAKDTVWVTLNARGLAAFDSHIAALRELAGEEL